MTLKIYGSKISFPADKTLFVANYLNLDYEFIELNMMKAEHKAPEYLKINPFGKVPGLDDNGFTLFESNTMIRYLAQKAKSDLYPEDFKERILVDQWLDFVTNHIHQSIARIAFNRMFARNMPNMEYDEKSVAFGEEMLSKFLPVIEKRIKSQGNLVTSKLSLADFSLFASLEPCNAAEVDLSKYPSLCEWRNEMREQDWYTDVYSSFENNLKESVAAMMAAK